jgi:hypothetical protein
VTIVREDPIVEEVRRIRRAYFAQCGNDMHKMFEDLRRRQAEHPERLVSFPSTPVKPVTKRRESA